MRPIDADRLLQRTKFYNLKNGNRAIDEVDILHAPTVNAIPLDKVKQAREEIEHLDGTTDDYNRNGEVIFRNMVDVDEVLEILDRLIESEDNK